jgi:hypothetical protein
MHSARSRDRGSSLHFLHDLALGAGHYFRVRVASRARAIVHVLYHLRKGHFTLDNIAGMSGSSSTTL